MLKCVFDSGRCFGALFYLLAIVSSNIGANQNLNAEQEAFLKATRKTDDLVVLFKDLQNSVVTVWSEFGSGTGFIVDARGLVLTNQHVIGPSEYIAAQFDPNTKVSGRLLVADPGKDIALIWINLDSMPIATVAEIAKDDPKEPSLLEGERVFTIGSPLSQSKIITTGIASKIESRVIISDVNINHGNSGGPLFNSVGKVVGITTFLDAGKPNGPGLSGIVRIEEALSLIDEAKKKMAEGAIPPSRLLPVEPTHPYPVDAIKTSLKNGGEDFDPYFFRSGDYDVGVITPLLIYQGRLGGTLAAIREKQKRNKAEEAVQETFRPFDDLKDWEEYIGGYKPVVIVRASPRLQETFLSALGRGLAAYKGQYGGPANLKFKTDFYRLKLTCGGQEIEPILPGKIAEIRNERNSFVSVTDATYQGFYTYPPDAISPECGQVVLDIYSEKNPNKYTRKVLDKKTVERTWADFEAYRATLPNRPALQLAQARPAGTAVSTPDIKPITLATVKRIFVDTFGEDNLSKGLRGWIVNAISENTNFIVTENKDRADAVLKRDVLENTPTPDLKPNDARFFAFRLVSKDGDVLWNTTQEAQSDAADLAKQVIAKLLRAVDKQKGDQAPDFSGTYSGDVRNTARNMSAKFEIQLKQVNGEIYGCSTVERPLGGSGGFHGKTTGSEVTFETESRRDRIQFTGKLQGDEIKGTFTVRSAPDAGEFSLKRVNSIAPPIGYDAAQCRKD